MEMTSIIKNEINITDLFKKKKNLILNTWIVEKQLTIAKYLFDDMN